MSQNILKISLFIVCLLLPCASFGSEGSFELDAFVGAGTPVEVERTIQPLLEAKKDTFMNCFTDLSKQHPELSFNSKRIFWLRVNEGKILASPHRDDDLLSDTNQACLIEAFARIKAPKVSGTLVAELRFRKKVTAKPHVTEIASKVGKARFKKRKSAEKAFLKEIDIRMVDLLAQDRWEDCLRKHRQNSFRGTIEVAVWAGAYGKPRVHVQHRDYVHHLSPNAVACFQKQAASFIGERLPVSKNGEYVALIDIEFEYQKGRKPPKRSLLAGASKVHELSVPLGQMKQPVDFAKQLSVFDGEKKYRVTAVANACRTFSKSKNAASNLGQLRGLCFAMPTCQSVKDRDELWSRIQAELEATAASKTLCKAKAKECKTAFKRFKRHCAPLQAAKD